MARHEFYPRAFLAALLVSAAARGGDLPGLAALARTALGADQGVYLEAADGSVLLAQAAARPVHPASVSKIPTTLALLRKFGPDYRFTTSFAASGPLQDGTLEGDLLVEGDGDPDFLDENALLVAAQLNALGLHRITGTLQPRGALLFDWQPDDGAAHLQRVLSGLAPPEAWSRVRSLAPAAQFAPQPALSFGGGGGAQNAGPTASTPARPLLIHRSQPLLALIKDLNDYSNNIFSPLAAAAGGAAGVEALARDAVPASMRAEITLGDGAGMDARNRLSPRAAVRLLRALEQELGRTGHSLVEILPVAGVDAGTLQDRLDAAEDAGRVVGKTGTFGDYGACALIGAISTPDRGTVYFAILNHGVRVAEARRRQNRFLHQLLARLHAQRWEYQRDERPAVSRAQVILAGMSAP